MAGSGCAISPCHELDSLAEYGIRIGLAGLGWVVTHNVVMLFAWIGLVCSGVRYWDQSPQYGYIPGGSGSGWRCNTAVSGGDLDQAAQCGVSYQDRPVRANGILLWSVGLGSAGSGWTFCNGDLCAGSGCMDRLVADQYLLTN